MLLNLSNHPSALWGERQKKMAADRYGSVHDLPFPHIDPRANEKEVQALAKEYFEKIRDIFSEEESSSAPNAVHIQGEFTFVFRLVNMLKKAGITCLASTSGRDIEEVEKGKKIVTFNFVKFREY